VARIDTPVDSIRRTTRSASEIAADLRREFELAVHSRYGTQPKPDPVLATVFHALAVQVARVYDEAATVLPVAVLDDLIAALDLPVRAAEPAQAVVCFTGIDRRERVTPQTELVGYARTGEQLGFTLDEAVQLAPTELAFAAVYEAGRLQLLPGIRAPQSEESFPPAGTPVSLAAPPTIFLAFRADAAHLGELGIFFDILPQDERIARALGRSPWQLLNANGRVYADGILRAVPGRGGTNRLVWFAEAGRNTATSVGANGSKGASGGEETLDPMTVLAPIGEGPYGTRVWIFPTVPPDRRHLLVAPPAIANAIPRLVPADYQDLFGRPMAWVQIPLPAGTRGVADAIQHIAVNCATASNIEIWNEQLPFDRIGSTVALRPEGNPARHLLGVLSVVGESGTRYVEEADVSADPAHGRYRVRGGRVQCRPARTAAGRFDTYTMLRLLLCDGERANGLEPGAIRRIESKLDNVTAQVSNLTVSRGGSSPLAYADARLRFAELLRSRERVVTAADIEIASRAFEPRITSVDVDSGAEMTSRGLELVNVVRVRANPSEFADPDAELVRLRDSLERHLESRCVMGHRIRVTIDASSASA
jgi:hypothetical protein